MISYQGLLEPKIALTIEAFSLCLRLGFPFKLCAERDVVEKCPGVIEFSIPCPLQIPHRLNHAIHFLIPYQGEESCIDSRRIGIVRRISKFSP